eukprot:582056-Alexandrium_andersonii.AAC.1
MGEGSGWRPFWLDRQLKRARQRVSCAVTLRRLHSSPKHSLGSPSEPSAIGAPPEPASALQDSLVLRRVHGSPKLNL